MKNQRVIGILIGLCLIVGLVCLAFLPTFYTIFSSFPEILLGNTCLSPETKPPAPKKYMSAEFVLDQISPTEIIDAYYIDLQTDGLFWDPGYVGFPRTRLSEDEILRLLDLFVAGHLFHLPADGTAYQCVVKDAGQSPRLVPCPQGENYMDHFMSAKWDAEQRETVGVVQLHLDAGQLAEIRVYRSASGLAFEPYEKTGEWWLKGVAPPSDLLDNLASRVNLPLVKPLWPYLTSSLANSVAARIIGNHYWSALDVVRKSLAVNRTFGEIQDIRPAVGLNTFSSWMDSTSLFLTLRVVGSRGTGAVILQGYDCFDLQMVFEGKPIDDDENYVCH